MRILINGITINDTIRGVERYILEVTRHLAQIDNQNEYIILKAPWQNYMAHIKAPNFHFVKVKIPRGPILRNFWQAFLFPAFIRRFNPDIIHLPNTMPLFAKVCPVIVTIHDLYEYDLPESYPLIQRVSRRITVKREIEKTDSIITVSEYSRKRIIERFKVICSKVIAIWNGFYLVKAMSNFKDATIAGFDRYILFVSPIDYNKNVPVLIKAYAQLSPLIRKRYGLILVGRKGNDFRRVIALIEALNLSSSVIWKGFVNDSLLRVFYQKASLFVFPSKIEGFGFPVIEAMAHGTPVIASRAGALPEICGDAAILVDPNDPLEIKSAIEHVLGNDNLRESLSQKGKERAKLFDWEETAKRTLEVYQQVYKQTRISK